MSMQLGYALSVIAGEQQAVFQFGASKSVPNILDAITM
jgi:hypothetical protein